MPIKQYKLINLSARYLQPQYESTKLQANAGQLKSAFLCHSHKDELLVKGLIVLFQEYGINIYIDWQDHTMPDSPNIETAKKIQTAIKSRELFFFLATANSKISHWCPWEIGYADSSQRKIFIIQTDDNNVSYGNEYLDLYSKIDEFYNGQQINLAEYKAGSKSGYRLSTSNL